MAAPLTKDPPEGYRRKGLGAKAFLYDVRYRRWRFRQYTNVLYFTVLMILAWYWPPEVLWRLAAGAGIAAVGIAIRLWASGCVKKNEELAMDGPYAFVRHPLYVGNLLIGTGFALASYYWLPILAWWGLIYYLYCKPAIEREDRKLCDRFPDSWPAWAERTPALLPLALLKLQKLPRPGPWSLKQSMRNGEPLYAWGLACGMTWMARLFL
jgi:protein-S-isoprenylcysteine O-methyltransferase Ste14